MTGEHCGACIEAFDCCLCNICVHDSTSTAEPCCKEKHPGESCPVADCPLFEPDSCGTEAAVTIIDEMEGGDLHEQK